MRPSQRMCWPLLCLRCAPMSDPPCRKAAAVGVFNCGHSFHGLCLTSGPFQDECPACLGLLAEFKAATPDVRVTLDGTACLLLLTSAPGDCPSAFAGGREGSPSQGATGPLRGLFAEPQGPVQPQPASRQPAGLRAPQGPASASRRPRGRRGCPRPAPASRCECPGARPWPAWPASPWSPGCAATRGEGTWQAAAGRRRHQGTCLARPGEEEGEEEEENQENRYQAGLLPCLGLF